MQLASTSFFVVIMQFSYEMCMKIELVKGMKCEYNRSSS